jgi:hypothetical protein
MVNPDIYAEAVLLLVKSHALLASIYRDRNNAPFLSKQGHAG